MHYHNKKERSLPLGRRGYIAIISAIIITAILTVIALVFSSSNFLGRFDTENAEMKSISREVARGCLEYARLQISLNSSYAGGELKAIASSSCYILPIQTQGPNKIIQATSTVSNKNTNVRLTINGTTLKTISEEEY
ncbi:MAG: hypothetical protein AAB617_03145 [Patescibacteria group bacterium]|mgnify:CR=1 FL=1